MSKVFDFKRFVNYLSYDLRSAGNNFGLSMVVIGVLPVITFAFTQLMMWLISPDYLGNGFGISIRVITIFCAIVVVELIAPSKLYGKITDRRYGTDWLLVPASTLEKFVSMLIILCIVLPLAMCIALLLSDTVLALIFPARYGGSIFSLLHGINIFNLELSDEPELAVHMNLFAIIAFSWILNILIYALGAVVFKKSKVAKTILSMCIISAICGNIFALCFDFTTTATELMMTTNPFKAVNIFNGYMNAIIFAGILLAGGGIYYRLRTIQH